MALDLIKAERVVPSGQRALFLLHRFESSAIPGSRRVKRARRGRRLSRGFDPEELKIAIKSDSWNL
jgi:hypothetical protein